MTSEPEADEDEAVMRQQAVENGDENAQRDELRAALGRLMASAQAYHERHDGQATPGSQASREAEAAGPVRQKLERALAWGGILLASSFDHLTGLEDLLAANRTIHAPRSVTRSVIEASARAWWLLDPSIDHRARVARLLTELLASDREYRTAAAGAGRNQDVTAADADIQAVVEFAGEHHFTVLRDRDKDDKRMGSPRAVDADRLNSTDLITRFFATVRAPWFGELGWRFFSTAVHGTLWGLAQAHAVEPHPTRPDVLIASRRSSLNDVRDMVVSSAMAFAMAFNAQVDLYGWERRAWDASVAEVFTELSS